MTGLLVKPPAILSQQRAPSHHLSKGRLQSSDALTLPNENLKSLQSGFAKHTRGLLWNGRANLALICVLFAAIITASTCEPAFELYASGSGSLMTDPHHTDSSSFLITTKYTAPPTRSSKAGAPSVADTAKFTAESVRPDVALTSQTPTISRSEREKPKAPSGQSALSSTLSSARSAWKTKAESSSTPRSYPSRQIGVMSTTSHLHPSLNKFSPAFDNLDYVETRPTTDKHGSEVASGITKLPASLKYAVALATDKYSKSSETTPTADAEKSARATAADEIHAVYPSSSVKTLTALGLSKAFHDSTDDPLPQVRSDTQPTTDDPDLKITEDVLEVTRVAQSDKSFTPLRVNTHKQLLGESTFIRSSLTDAATTNTVFREHLASSPTRHPSVADHKVSDRTLPKTTPATQEKVVISHKSPLSTSAVTDSDNLTSPTESYDHTTLPENQFLSLSTSYEEIMNGTHPSSVKLLSFYQDGKINTESKTTLSPSTTGSKTTHTKDRIPVSSEPNVVRSGYVTVSLKTKNWTPDITNKNTNTYSSASTLSRSPKMRTKFSTETPTETTNLTSAIKSLQNKVETLTFTQASGFVSQTSKMQNVTTRSLTELPFRRTGSRIESTKTRSASSQFLTLPSSRRTFSSYDDTAIYSTSLRNSGSEPFQDTTGTRQAELVKESFTTADPVTHAGLSTGSTTDSKQTLMDTTLSSVINGLSSPGPRSHSPASHSTDFPTMKMSKGAVTSTSQRGNTATTNSVTTKLVTSKFPAQTSAEMYIKSSAQAPRLQTFQTDQMSDRSLEPVTSETSAKSSGRLSSTTLLAVSTIRHKSESDMITRMSAVDPKGVTRMLESTTSPILGPTTSSILGSTTSPIIGSTTSPLLESKTSPLLGSTTSPMLEQTTSAMLESTTSPMLESTTSPMLESTTSPMLESTTSPMLESTTSFILESTTSPMLESTTSPMLESTTSPILESTTSPLLESTTSPLLESTTSPLLESTTSPLLESTTSPLLGWTTSPIFESTTSNMLAPTTSPMLESTTSLLLEPATSAMLESTTSPLLESTTSAMLESTTSPMLEQTTSPTVESTTSFILESTTSPMLESATSSMLESTTNAMLESTTSPMLESTISPMLESTTSPTLESTTSPLLKSTTSPLLESTTSPLLGSTTSPIFESTTSNMLAPTTSPMLESTTSPMLESTTSPMLKSTTSPLLEPTTSPLLGSTTSPILESTSPILESTTSPILESTTSPMLESTTPLLLAPTTSPMLESTTPPLLESTTSPMLESTTSPMLESTTSPLLESTTSPMLESTTSPSLEWEATPTALLKSTTSPVIEKTSSPWLDSTISPLESTTSITLEATDTVVLESTTSTSSDFTISSLLESTTLSLLEATGAALLESTSSTLKEATSPLLDSTTSPLVESTTFSTEKLSTGVTSPLTRRISTSWRHMSETSTVGTTNPATTSESSIDMGASTIKTISNNAPRTEVTAAKLTTNYPVNECDLLLDDCDRVTEICVDTKDKYLCDCRQGYYRHQLGACLGGISFYGALTITSITLSDNDIMATSVYTPELEDSTSRKYVKLAGQVQNAIDSVFLESPRSRTSYQGCRVIRFRSGSIVADFQLLLGELSTLDGADLLVLLRGAAENSTLGGLAVAPESMSVTPLDECSQGLHDCSQRATCLDQPRGFTCFCNDGYRDPYHSLIPGRYCQAVDRPGKPSSLNRMFLIAASVLTASGLLLVAATVLLAVIGKTCGPCRGKTASRPGAVKDGHHPAVSGVTAPRKISDAFLAGGDVEAGVWCPGEPGEAHTDAWSTESSSSGGPDWHRGKSDKKAPIANISELEFEIEHETSYEDETTKTGQALGPSDGPCHSSSGDKLPHKTYGDENANVVSLESGESKTRGVYAKLDLKTMAVINTVASVPDDRQSKVRPTFV